MTTVDADASIRQWMQTPAGHRTIHSAAVWLAKKLVHKNVPLSVINLPGRAAPDEIVGQIESELHLFILENRSHITAKLMAPEANRGRILANVMVRFFLDRARASPEHDPWRYLYKQAANVLREHPEFHIKAKRGVETYYSRVVPSMEMGPLSPEDFAGIGLPDAYAHVSDLATAVQKKVLVVLAGHFWETLTATMTRGEPVWVELRAFVNWMGRFVCLQNAAPQSLDVADAPEGVHHDENIDLALIAKWTRMLMKQLTDPQSKVYYHHYCCGLSLSETALRMGLKSASHAWYHLDQFIRKVQSFTADLPWLSPDNGEEANASAQRYFSDKLCELLEKRLATP